MKKLLALTLSAFSTISMAAQEVEITTAQARSLIKNVTKTSQSVHDPSVVWEPQSKRYYIFGSHRGMAYTTDMRNWTGAGFSWRTATKTNVTNAEAFVTPAVKKVKKGGAEVDLPAFNAMEWSKRTDANYNIDGNMWAPDVIWNPTMKKWCMYLSVNGDAWHSSIILLTSDNIAGPYLYQGPVVICGFQDSGHSYKGTDLELVLGAQSSLPSRYAVGNGWGRRWPHTIDPAVFYDEDGKLWMVYGSWSGGIWMLELNEENGLRDYDVAYPSTGGSSDGVTSDPYFGTKIAGGYYVSGEGPYIEHIGNYYYLFVSYGGFAPGGYDEKGNPQGGYEMRVFRSEKPNGPYKDALGRSAIFTQYVLNYGNGADTRGMKLLGSYNDWGFMKVGECAQGHNSIIAAEDGRTYLVYHTKFNNGTIGHLVRTHQVFQNKNGWLVAAPFEYNGETVVSADVASKQLVADIDIPGVYQVLFHKYKMDYAKFEEVTPVELELTADGKVTGARTGSWSVDEGTSYISLTLNGLTYHGVILEEQLDGKNIKTIAFSAISNGGFSVWGYKYRGDFALADYLNSHSMPVANGQEVRKNIDLLNLSLTDNLNAEWTSSEPEIITNVGKYYPIGLSENTSVSLQARLTAGNYFWQQAYQVTALSESNVQPQITTWQDGMLAHYKFDEEELSNSLNANEKAQLLSLSTTQAPTVDKTELLRNGSTVHVNFGQNGKESYVEIPNPLKGKNLADGATISFFVKRLDDNLWDALFGMEKDGARLFMTGNLYVGYNDGKKADEANQVYNNWIDINHPESVKTGRLGVNGWNLVTITFSRKVQTVSGGVTIYVNGTKVADKYIKEKLNGVEATTKTGFDYNLLVDHLAACDKLWLGKGSFWGSADARFDDVIIYDRPLSLGEVVQLSQMIDRADTDFKTAGIETVAEDQPAVIREGIYDLMGRKMTGMQKRGIYVINGKKYIR